MTDSLLQAQLEWRRRAKVHLEALGLPADGWPPLLQALLGGRWTRSLIPEDWQALTVRVEALHSAAAIAALLETPPRRPEAPPPASAPGFAWSPNARHILSLFDPWQPQDGYAAAVIRAAEQRLGYRLPEPLRSFYRSWGTRKKLVAQVNSLEGPHMLEVRTGVLIIGVENQGVTFWGVRLADLAQENPPVVWAYNLTDPPEELVWQLSHPHLADFLDVLTYHHAFCGGATYSGQRQATFDWPTMKHLWQRIDIPAVPMCFTPDSPVPEWTIYGRPGQAIDDTTGAIVAGTAADLDEIAESLHITWRTRR